MRFPLLCTLLLAACAGGDKAAETTEEATGPAALTAAAVAGTWNGTSTAAGSDSVLSTWTITMTSDSTVSTTVLVKSRSRFRLFSVRYRLPISL